MEYSQETIITVWGGSLLIGVVVIIVVAILLRLILGTAKKIEWGAGQIWIAGKMVANNTIHIPIFLAATNRVAGKILNNAEEIHKEAKIIETHIEGCPGCPECVLSQKISL